ncbi:MAG: hypothetical protein FWG55_05805 [Candidatus Bathyarchaeota archaeon]|nr:hypothetical protein [Candidatus Termiticorpusculum sp.]
MAIDGKQKAELAFMLTKHVLVPVTVKLVKGSFLNKKTINIQITANAVFTFYNSIAVEDYHRYFVTKITHTKTEKNIIKLGSLDAHYSLNPNVVTLFPLGIASYGEELFEEEKELSVLYNRINQIRLFISPSQTEMPFDKLFLFITEFDELLGETDKSLRDEGKIPLRSIVKHVILKSDDVDFIQKISKLHKNDGFTVRLMEKGVIVTYSDTKDVLAVLKVLL